MRIPKTGSTTLETSVRMAGCMGEGDVSPAVEDSFLPQVNIPMSYTEHKAHKRSLMVSINKKRIEGVEDLTDEEQQLLLKIKENNDNNTFYDVNLHHATLDDLTHPDSLQQFGFLTEEQIYQYNHYAVLRHPMKRLISCIIFAHSMRYGSRPVPLVMKEFHKEVLERGFRGLAYRKQIDYFKYKGETHYDGKRLVTPLLFEDYTNEVNKTIVALGGTALAEIPKFKSQHANRIMDEDKPTIETWIDPYPEVKQVILDFYAEDIALWEEISGQSIQ
jgi:hypothetical protein